MNEKTKKVTLYSLRKTILVCFCLFIILPPLLAVLSSIERQGTEPTGSGKGPGPQTSYICSYGNFKTTPYTEYCTKKEFREGFVKGLLASYLIIPFGIIFYAQIFIPVLSGLFLLIFFVMFISSRKKDLKELEKKKNRNFKGFYKKWFP